MISSVDPKVNAQLSELIEKYAGEGKEISCYLEKLLQEKSIDYTDYLNLDTLLTLQKPRTGQPDEMIFIAYHQIVELFFRLIIWELKQLTATPAPSLNATLFREKIERVNRYVEVLINSFQVILQGLDKEQFQKFRYTLFPASGFQSHQYRLIEIYLTDLENLVSVGRRDGLEPGAEIPFLFERLYWKVGMINPRNGEKSLTLVDFENRYDELLLEHARACRLRNVWRVFQQYKEPEELVDSLRRLDTLLNVRWQGLHYQVAMKHLSSDENTRVRSTGGTHWRKYLHPKFQQIIFFPSLWQEHELAAWGEL